MTRDGVIGEVPTHLRHLCNLVTEVEDEVKAAITVLMMAKKRHELVRDTFAMALQSNAPFDVDNDYSGFKICESWKVTGSKAEDVNEEGGIRPSDILMRAMKDMLKGRFEHHGH